jgi:hypothetical protein
MPKSECRGRVHRPCSELWMIQRSLTRYPILYVLVALRGWVCRDTYDENLISRSLRRVSYKQRECEERTYQSWGNISTKLWCRIRECNDMGKQFRTNCEDMMCWWRGRWDGSSKYSSGRVNESPSSVLSTTSSRSTLLKTKIFLRTRGSLSFLSMYSQNFVASECERSMSSFLVKELKLPCPFRTNQPAVPSKASCIPSLASGLEYKKSSLDTTSNSSFRKRVLP